MFRQSEQSYLNAYHVANPMGITPFLRPDLLAIEGDIDSRIATFDDNRLEEDFGKYLHLIRKLENARDANQTSLTNYRTIFNKIKTKLEESIQPEYIDLITRIFEYEQTEGHNQDLVTSAVELANTFKYNTSSVSKTTLTDATNVLADNSAENRNKFLVNIDKNRKGKGKIAVFAIGVALTFLGAAMIAAGIACTLTGVGSFLGSLLITSGIVWLLTPGVLMLTTAGCKSYGSQEDALVGFGDGMINTAKSKDASKCTAKIGLFSTTKDKIEATPLNEDVGRTLSLN